MTTPHVYTLPSGRPFLQDLATGLRERFGSRLSDALIFLPTRRAVRALGDTFVETGTAEGQFASLLPTMRPLADIDPEEPPFEPGDLALHIPPAISTAQRRFELTRLVRVFYERQSGAPLEPASALALVDPLIRILDDADMEEVSGDNLGALDEIAEFAAEHFQNAALFYRIIQTYWPERLKELGFTSPMARRVAVLNALTDRWGIQPPDYPVIIAGSTGTLKATARLMRCVAQMPSGLIVLPGLDVNLRDTAWDAVGADHAQGSLKNLIQTIGITRDAVRVWPYSNSGEDASTQARIAARRRLMSEALVPIKETDDWPTRIASLRREDPAYDPFVEGLENLSIIEAATADEEALTVALIMRKVLSEAGATAALVTPDPALARRVRSALRRWQVDVDYSQGEPLEETELGAFLSGIVRLAQDMSNPLELAFLCKHRLCALGLKPGELRRSWERAEPGLFRGLRPSEAVLQNASDADFLGALSDRFQPLIEVCEMDTVLPSVWARALTHVAESLADTDNRIGAERLWREDAGEQAASCLEDIMAYGDALGLVTLSEFSQLLALLMRGRAVRPRFGTHPRLQILGPLEARMLKADVIILGGLNEGMWPAAPSQDPLLSRAMRQSLGLSLSERRYGLAAHDFAELSAHPTVFLTRAQRGDDGPQVASRWLWRLQTLVRGALGNDDAMQDLGPTLPYLDWARALDHVPPDQVQPAPAPTPRPAVDQRWPRGRRLSVTQISTWVRDPYAVYARHVLRLKPLDMLDMPVGPREYGTAIHAALEHYAKDQDNPVSLQAKDLAAAFERALLETGYSPVDMIKEQPRLLGAAERVMEWTRQRQSKGFQIAAIEAEATLYLPEIDFTLTTKADRLERSAQGFAIIDFKTGSPSSIPTIKAGFDPQLPLMGLILENGGFAANIDGSSDTVTQLSYMRVSATHKGDLETIITAPEARAGLTPDAYIDAARDMIENLVREFDNPDTAYLSQPRSKFQNPYGDYDHLARRDEWAKLNADSDL